MGKKPRKLLGAGNIVLLDPGANSQVFTLKNFIRHCDLYNSCCVLYFNKYLLLKSSP